MTPTTVFIISLSGLAFTTLFLIAIFRINKAYEFKIELNNLAIYELKSMAYQSQQTSNWDSYQGQKPTLGQLAFSFKRIHVKNYLTQQQRRNFVPLINSTYSNTLQLYPIPIIYAQMSAIR